MITLPLIFLLQLYSCHQIKISNQNPKIVQQIVQKSCKKSSKNLLNISIHMQEHGVIEEDVASDDESMWRGACMQNVAFGKALNCQAFTVTRVQQSM